MPTGRPSVCVTVSHTSDGANAPSPHRTGARTADTTSIRRRPLRSARKTRPTANTMPQRTTAPAAPWAVSEEPNSSAAKVMVWVNRVLT